MPNEAVKERESKGRKRPHPSNASDSNVSSSKRRGGGGGKQVRRYGGRGRRLRKYVNPKARKILPKPKFTKGGSKPQLLRSSFKRRSKKPDDASERKGTKKKSGKKKKKTTTKGQVAGKKKPWILTSRGKVEVARKQKKRLARKEARKLAMLKLSLKKKKGGLKNKKFPKPTAAAAVARPTPPPSASEAAAAALGVVAKKVKKRCWKIPLRTRARLVRMEQSNIFGGPHSRRRRKRPQKKKKPLKEGEVRRTAKDGNPDMDKIKLTRMIRRQKKKQLLRAVEALEKQQMRYMPPQRLYVNSIFTGYRRGRTIQREHTALLRINDVNCKADTRFYIGKRCVYCYTAKTLKRNPMTKKMTHLRMIWGTVMRAHGGSGAVRAKFVRNLPGQAMGKRVRVMLYPSMI